MMSFKVGRRSAAGHGAAVVIAREHLLAEPRCDGGRGSLGYRRVERAEDPRVARRALEHLGPDVDLATGAVLRRAPAVLTLLIGDLVCGAARTGAGRDHGTAQRLDEVSVGDLASALGCDH